MIELLISTVPLSNYDMSSVFGGVPHRAAGAVYNADIMRYSILLGVAVMLYVFIVEDENA